MMISNQFSTASFTPHPFKHHGVIESRVIGNLFIQEATGPFNREILLAMESVHAKARKLLAYGGPWGALFAFKGNALTTPEMLDDLKKYLAAQVARNTESVATGLVLSPDVEGAALMSRHYVRAWRDAGVRCEAFKSFNDAHDWVSEQVDAKIDLLALMGDC